MNPKFIIDMRYENGEECHHTGCANHASHLCEGCGRKGAHTPDREYIYPGSRFLDSITPDEMELNFAWMDACEELPFRGTTVTITGVYFNDIYL